MHQCVLQLTRSLFSGLAPGVRVGVSIVRVRVRIRFTIIVVRVRTS